MTDDNKDEPAESFGDELVEIKDLDTMADQMRRQGVSVFNERYQNEGIGLGRKDGVFKNPRRLSKKTLEKIIKLRDVKEILQQKLPYNKETEYYSINVKLFWQCVESISKNIFYNVANALVDAGIYEMVFDPETNDFAWRVTAAYKDKLAKGDIDHDFKDHDETNRDPDNGFPQD